MDVVSRAVEAVINGLPNVIIKIDEPMKDHTSFKIGGPVRVMLFPGSMPDFIRVCELLHRFDVVPFIMGNGSNILASDESLDLVVVNTSGVNEFELINGGAPDHQGNYEIAVDAGALLSKLAVYACENELKGLEFAHGIPGTLGGAVVMNAGAYGGEMKDVVIRSSVYNVDAGVYELSTDEHNFAYRHSRFSKSDDVILSSVIRLQKGNKTTIKQKMDELSLRRRKSQPLEVPSGGSTFKRPKESYAAALIEQAGLKGYTIGRAQVSDKHAGFIVNKGNASFKDTMAVIEYVQEVIFRQFGIVLELEVKVLHGK